MKNILILSYSNPETDPRVKKQLSFFGAKGYKVFVGGIGALKNSAATFYSIYTVPPFSITRKAKRFFSYLFRNYEYYYWDINKKNFLSIVQDHNYDLILANDIHTLPLALSIKKNEKTKVWFDAHEYHPGEFEESLVWKFLDRPYLKYLCKKYIPYSNAFSTVSYEIAEEYNKLVKVKAEVLMNTTDYKNLNPSSIENSQVKLIHHGAAIKGRKIELMIEMMDLLGSGYTLDLMLTHNKSSYYRKLEELASSRSNVNLIPAVQQEEIVAFINQYDIGVYILNPSNFNNLNALPNKLFDFIQARLCLAISPSPEMAKIVRKYNLGVIAKDYSPKSLAESIRSLSKSQILEYKMNADKSAIELSTVANYKVMEAMVNLL